MSKAKVSMPSLHWQSGLQKDNVLHLTHLVKQVSVDYVFMTKPDKTGKGFLWCHETLWLNKTFPNI